MNTERLIHMPQCSTIDLSALCNSSNSIWNTIKSHRWVKLSCENIGMCLSYVPFTLVIRLINCWDFIHIWYNKMLSSQWDNDNQHFVYIIVSWYFLGIITRQGFLFSCSCMNKCTCYYYYYYYCYCRLENKSTLLTISRLWRYCGPSNYRFNFLLYWYAPWVFFWCRQCAFVFPIYVRKYRK